MQFRAVCTILYVVQALLAHAAGERELQDAPLTFGGVLGEAGVLDTCKEWNSCKRDIVTPGSSTAFSWSTGTCSEEDLSGLRAECNLPGQKTCKSEGKSCVDSFCITSCSEKCQTCADEPEDTANDSSGDGASSSTSDAWVRL